MVTAPPEDQTLRTAPISKRATIFYFSGTGNTWWVANELAAALRDADIVAEIHSIEQVSTEQVASLIASSQLVGFGYPIYGSDLPLPIQSFISELTATPSQLAFVFCTQWLYSGDGASLGAAMLKERGFAVQWGEHFHMPSNVSVSLLPFALHTKPANIPFYLRHSKFRARRLARAIASNRPLRRGFNFVATLAGLMQRAPYRRHLHKFRNDLTPDPATCTLCGLCVELCPVDNFAVVSDRIQSRGHCVLCLRCYNFCPAQAMLYRRRPHRGEPPYRGPIPNFDPATIAKDKKHEQS